MQARSLGNQLAQLMFPQRHCLLCHAITGEPGLCESCLEIQKSLRHCDVCAVFVESPGLCGHCGKRRSNFVQARSAWPYGGRLRQHLLSFKYHEQTWLRRPLGLMLAETYQEHFAAVPFDGILPTPLSAERGRSRGYNQSELLSKVLAAETGIKHRSGILLRVKDTPPLATYDGSQRQAILKHAFAATPEAEGLRLLVVDDIYTSGATLQACAGALRKMGASEVYGIMVSGFDGRQKAGILPIEG